MSVVLVVVVIAEAVLRAAKEEAAVELGLRAARLLRQKRQQQREGVGVSVRVKVDGWLMSDISRHRMRETRRKLRTLPEGGGTAGMARREKGGGTGRARGPGGAGRYGEKHWKEGSMPLTWRPRRVV